MFLKRVEQDVFILTLQSFKNKKGEFENRFSQGVVDALNICLDQVLAENARALVITGGTSKFFSNGHDVDWLELNFESGESQRFIKSFYKLMARLLCFPLPTVAAINGHAFAGGCLLALAQDYRVMGKSRGYICMNEIDMLSEERQEFNSKSRIQPGAFAGADKMMIAVLRSKISPTLSRDMLLRGIRFDAVQAQAVGLVDIASDNPFDEAVALAQQLGKKAHVGNRRTFATFKLEMTRNIIEILTDNQPDSLIETTLSNL